MRRTKNRQSRATFLPRHQSIVSGVRQMVVGDVVFVKLFEVVRCFICCRFLNPLNGIFDLQNFRIFARVHTATDSILHCVRVELLDILVLALCGLSGFGFR